MKALNAIRLIRKFFTKKELLSLVTSNFYSILYYNSEIWHLPILKSTLKQNLLSASAKALRVCNGTIDYNMSFIDLHKVCDRATPEMYMKYKLALSLYKLYNVPFNPIEFQLLNFNQILTGRQLNFCTVRSNSFKVGMNCLSNRLHSINNLIPLSWLNLSQDSFKIKCKEKMIRF